MKYPHILGSPGRYYDRTEWRCLCCGCARKEYISGRVVWYAAGSGDLWCRPGEPPCPEGATDRRTVAETRRDADRLSEAELALDKLEALATGEWR